MELRKPDLGHKNVLGRRSFIGRVFRRSPVCTAVDDFYTDRILFIVDTLSKKINWE